MKEKYIIRNKILEYLFVEASKEEFPQDPQKLISTIEVSKSRKIPILKVDLYHELLHERKEIECYTDGPTHEMKITIKGRQSYLDKTYIVAGRKEFWDRIYDPLKIIIPILAIAISLIALILNYNSSKEQKKSQKEIENLKQQMELLRK